MSSVGKSSDRIVEILEYKKHYKTIDTVLLVASLPPCAVLYY